MPAHFTAGRLTILDDQGNPIPGARIYTLVTGTATHKNAFTTAALTTPVTYTSDGAGGLFLATDTRGEANLWLGSGLYTITAKTSAGVVIWSSDDEQNEGANAASALETALDGIGGAAKVGWQRTGFTVPRDVNIQLQESFVHITEEGATTTGDQTTAIQAVIDKAKVYGRTIIVPAGAPYQYTSLNLNAITTGLRFVGEGDPRGATIGNCSALRCIATGAGTGISIGSSLGVGFLNIALAYNSASFTGTLVGMTKTAALDTGLTTFEGVLFTGEGSAINAARLLYLDQCFSNTVKRSLFRYANNGMETGTGADGVNILTLDDCTFQVLNSNNVLLAGGGGHQAINILNSNFEPLVNGKCSGVTMGAGAGNILGFTAKGNWFGDVSVSGGVRWIRLQTANGVDIAGNFFGTPGAGAGDYAIELSTCLGVYVGSNYFQAKALLLPDNSVGVEFTNNSVPFGDTAVSSAAAVPPVLRNNIGMTDTNGGTFRVAGGSAPGYYLMPGSGATAEFGLVQNADQIFFQDKTGGANRIQYGVKTGALYLATPGAANQTAVALYAGSGAPNNAQGADGSIYFRSDGGAGTTVYLKVAGTWTGRA